MLRGYTEAAVTVTSALVTFVSRFALQVSSKPCEHCKHQVLPACLRSVLPLALTHCNTSRACFVAFDIAGGGWLSEDVFDER